MAKTPEKTRQESAVSLDEALKRVKRPVPKLDKDGKPTGKTELKPIDQQEVLAFRVTEVAVVVVTKDGQKFTAER